MAHGFGTAISLGYRTSPNSSAVNAPTAASFLERIQRRAQRKERGNALDNLPEPPALVIGERLAAAPIRLPSWIAATFSRRSSTSARIAAAFAAKASERRSS
jgi:hypothetical protein